MSPRIGDGSDFTFAAWVKWDGGGNWQRIFDCGDGGTRRYFYLTPNAGGNMRFTITTSGWGGEQRLNAPPLTTGRWTHLAVTIRGNTGRLFVNGRVVATNNSMTINPSEVGTEINYLGESQFVADPLFDGALDDVHFHNEALEDAVILRLATAGGPRFASGTLDVGLVGLPFRDSLVPMVEGGAGNVHFEKVNGPDWLSVSADGALLGVPQLSDAGEGTMLVRVTDALGLSDTAEIPYTIGHPDPLARYSFDDSAASALGGEPAVLSGGSAFADGVLNKALKLDGSNDHVILPEGIASSGQFTFAAWVKWDGGGNWQRIFDFGNGTDSFLFLTPKSSSNRLRFAIRKGGKEEAMETGVLPVNSWTHVAVTLGEGMGKLYVNGVLRSANNSMTLTPADIRPKWNYLGRSQWPDPFFDGSIDEVHLFPRVLSAVEIDSLRSAEALSFDRAQYDFPALASGEVFESFLADHLAGGTPPYTFSKTSGPTWLTVEANGRLSGIPGDSETGTNRFTIQAIDSRNRATSAVVTIPVKPVPGLVMHYEFEDNSFDRVSGRHGVRFGNPGFGDGPSGRALILDGGDDYLRFPANALSSLGDATLVIRYRWQGGGAWQRLFDYGNNTSEYLMLTPRNFSGLTKFRMTTGGSGSAQSLFAPASPLNEWTHAAITLSGNSGTLYLNGSRVDGATITLDPRDISPTLNYLGKSQWPDPLFRGWIDDFRIYDRALDAGEVGQLARGSAPVVVEPGYQVWARGHSLHASGKGGWNEDPDHDGRSNVFEWLMDTDPLRTDGGMSYLGEMIVLGDKSYLTLKTRMRKSRPRFNLIAQGAVDPAEFDAPGSGNLVVAMPTVDDGEFEWLRWIFRTPVSQGSKAFIRLKVTEQ